MSAVLPAHHRTSIKVDIHLVVLIQFLSKEMVQLGCVNEAKCLTSCLFLQLLAHGWHTSRVRRMFSECVNEWMTKEFVVAFTLTLILPRSQDCENLTDHGAIHSVSKCCQPAHSSNREQPWFMLPAERVREVESFPADVFTAESLQIEQGGRGRSEEWIKSYSPSHLIWGPFTLAEDRLLLWIWKFY